MQRQNDTGNFHFVIRGERKGGKKSHRIDARMNFKFQLNLQHLDNIQSICLLFDSNLNYSPFTFHR